MKKIITLLLLLLLIHQSKAQGLKDIIVETYYIADSTDEKLSGLPKNSITYRVFAELEEGYTLQTIFGFSDNPLIIGSSTGFYNHNWGGDIGDMINPEAINANNLAFDSWLTIGAATKFHQGVLLPDDKDGSILNKERMNKADGLIEMDIPQIVKYNLDLGIFEYNNPVTALIADNGLIAVLGGQAGPTTENRVLLAQLTTNGELFFQLNIQLGTPDRDFVQYVAKNPAPGQLQFDGLSYGNIIMNNP